MSSVTLNGHTYTDDANASTGLANGGHRTRLVPMLSDAVVDLAAKQAAALASQNAAATSETNAAASAATAVNAPGTSATSTTSLAIGTGSKTLTIQTGKSIVVGMSVKVAYTTDPTKWMAGDVTAYNSGTGSLTVNVTLTSSSGTFAAWTVSLAGATLASVLKSGDTMTGPLSVPAGASGTQVPQAQETLLKTGGTMTGALNEAATVSIASAATVNIGAAAANSITITGTTTITAFDTIAAGARRRLTFAAALTLTHNATSLILPGAANIATAAGDSGEFVSLGGGNWRCIDWQPAMATTAEMQAGSATSPRDMSPSLIAQAIAALSGPRSVQVFTADGTYTKPAGVTRILVEVSGGGGGGGRGAADYVGSGGGGGGYARKLITSPSASYAVTVGAAGTGAVGAAGNGTSGGTSSFGAVASATGGGGGLGNATSARVVGGSGGVGSGGDINLGGDDGQSATTRNQTTNFSGGHGGSAHLGGGGYSGFQGQAAAAGKNYGGGGGGGADAGDGANGAPGVVIVWEY